MSPFHRLQTRRQFFGRTATGIGAAALASLLGEDLRAADDPLKTSGALSKLHFAPKAKRVIYLFMSGGQKTLPVAPTIFKFDQHGKSGTWVSDLLPNIATIVDDIAVVKSLNTE